MISKPYLILGIDRKIGGVKDNNGGSGKSFTVNNVLNYVFNRVKIDGRNLTRENANFMLDGVTRETDIVYFEDLSPFYDFNSFLNFADGEIRANQKGGKMIVIPFEDFAKVVITMNAVPHEITDSLRRRLVVFECCDYYHEKGADYAETRTIRSDFGKNLFDENYTTEDWANDDNFMMYALQFYLNINEKIELEDSNMHNRKLIQQIGDAAMKYFENFFKDMSNLSQRGYVDSKSNLYVELTQVFENYKSQVGKNARSNQDFKIALDHYCELKSWPVIHKKRKPIGGTTNSVPHFNIDFGSIVIKNSEEEDDDYVDPFATAGQKANIDEEIETDLPF